MSKVSANIYNFYKKCIQKNTTHSIVFWLLISLLILIIIIPLISNYEVNSTNINNILSPMSYNHLFGTDEKGADFLIVLCRSTQISIIIAVCVTFYIMTLGIIVGTLSGFFYNTIIDKTLMMIVDIAISIPRLPILLIFSSVGIDKLIQKYTFIQNIDICKSISFILITGNLFGWMKISRIIRSEVINLINKDYILVARALGIPEKKIILKHIIPNCISYAIIYFPMIFIFAIGYETSISFLGLGLSDNHPSLGNLLNKSIDYMHDSIRLFIIPGIVLIYIQFSVNYLSDTITNFIDNKGNII